MVAIIDSGIIYGNVRWNMRILIAESLKNLRNKPEVFSPSCVEGLPFQVQKLLKHFVGGGDGAGVGLEAAFDGDKLCEFL